MQLRISQLGTMVGSLASTATYSSLVAAGTMAGSAFDVALDATGFILGKGAGRVFGFGAEIAVASTCRFLGRSASATTTTYTPLLAGAAATIVGITTGLAITGTEYMVNSTIKKIQEKYWESNSTVQLLDDAPVLIEEESDQVPGCDQVPKETEGK